MSILADKLGINLNINLDDELDLELIKQKVIASSEKNINRIYQKYLKKINLDKFKKFLDKIPFDKAKIFGDEFLETIKKVLVVDKLMDEKLQVEAMIVLDNAKFEEILKKFKIPNLPDIIKVLENFLEFGVIHLRALPSVLLKLSQHPNIKLIHDNRELECHLDHTKNIVCGSSCNYFNQSHARCLENLTIDSQLLAAQKNVCVAIIDTGVDSDHMDIKFDLDGRKRFQGEYNCTTNPVSFSVDGQDADQYNTHGTSVAGVVGGSGRNTNSIIGIAPNVKLISFRCYRIGEASFSESRLMRAYSKILQINQSNPAQPIVAVNVSQGPNLGNGSPVVICKNFNTSSDSGVNTLYNNNIPVIFSGGNSGDVFPSGSGASKDRHGKAYGTFNSFACTPKCLAVAWIDNNFIASPASSKGHPQDQVSKPDITLPGVFIKTAKAHGNCTSTNSSINNCYQSISGSSFSSPHAAGMVALTRCLLNMYLPNQIQTAQIFSIIKNSAVFTKPNLYDRTDQGKGVPTMNNIYNYIRNNLQMVKQNTTIHRCLNSGNFKYSNGSTGRPSNSINLVVPSNTGSGSGGSGSGGSGSGGSGSGSGGSGSGGSGRGGSGSGSGSGSDGSGSGGSGRGPDRRDSGSIFNIPDNLYQPGNNSGSGTGGTGSGSGSGGDSGNDDSSLGIVSIIGIVTLVIIFLSIIFYFYKRHQKKKLDYFYYY